MSLTCAAAAHASPVAQRDALLLEFVQDMAWLENSQTNSSDGSAQAASNFLDGAIDRLSALPNEEFSSLAEVADTFAEHQKLVNQLAAPARPNETDASMAPIDPNTITVKLQVQLENLNLNYLRLAQLVLFDELGDSERRLAISSQTKQHLLAVIQAYPVDKVDADGYLSAMWFIREGLKKWKCADEL